MWLFKLWVGLHNISWWLENMILEMLMSVNFSTLILIHSKTGVQRMVWSLWGTLWRIWLSHCATSWKGMSSVPNVIGICYWHSPSICTVYLGSIQPVTEMSTRNISWGTKGRWCKGLITLPPSCKDCLEIWSLNLQEPSRPVQGLLYLYVIWSYKNNFHIYNFSVLMDFCQIDCMYSYGSRMFSMICCVTFVSYFHYW